MIQISDTTSISQNVAQRSKRCWVKRLSPNEFKVVPKNPSKSKRTVLFTSEGILCVDAATGEECPANRWGTTCYHVFRALKHLHSLSKRQRRERAA